MLPQLKPPLQTPVSSAELFPTIKQENSAHVTAWVNLVSYFVGIQVNERPPKASS